MFPRLPFDENAETITAIPTETRPFFPGEEMNRLTNRSAAIPEKISKLRGLYF
jgi:hypothetical protein